MAYRLVTYYDLGQERQCWRVQYRKPYRSKWYRVPVGQFFDDVVRTEERAKGVLTRFVNAEKVGDTMPKVLGPGSIILDSHRKPEERDEILLIKQPLCPISDKELTTEQRAEDIAVARYSDYIIRPWAVVILMPRRGFLCFRSKIMNNVGEYWNYDEAKEKYNSLVRNYFSPVEVK